MPRILLADDDLAVLKSTSALLEAAGHLVVPAKNGAEAMECLRWEEFDLLITDIVMPGQEGLETIQKARQAHPRLKILAMTGGGLLSPTAYLTVAQKLGAHRTLAKPASGKELLRIIGEVLGEA